MNGQDFSLTFISCANGFLFCSPDEVSGRQDKVSRRDVLSAGTCIISLSLKLQVVINM